MDNTIGPRVDPSIRAFDFTALFEECFLDILPWSLFLLMLLVRLKFLLNRPKIIRVDRLCIIKEVCHMLCIGKDSELKVIGVMDSLCSC